MKAFQVLLLCVLSAFCSVSIGSDVSDHLQEISVTVDSGWGTGSGVIFVRDNVVFVWTAAHVVDSLRSTKTVYDSASGSDKKVVEFRDAMVIRTLIEDGRTVGRLELSAKILRYSDKEDLALLMVRKKGFADKGVTFDLEHKPVPLGTSLYHVGSLMGSMGANSMTTGIMSQHGRLIDDIIYDQTTVTAFPGSSGGGVYLQDGKYIGMIVRGAGEGFNLIVPIRRMAAWARDADVEWAINPNIELPKYYDDIPVEHSGAKFGG